ncbi:MAG TPA: restriction endonuclease subunit S [Elusimicrobiota bacterium]|nr:restriction endonuclease subunit S [Elusimicrobiota bacterium]
MTGTLSSGWQVVKLGIVCDVVPGYAFKSKDFQESGIPVIKIKNIRGDRTINCDDIEHVPESLFTPKLDKFILHDGDILVAMTGATAGKVGRLRTKIPMLLNQRVAKIVPTKANREYIWSVVSSDKYQNLFFHLADGAAQPNMSGSQIESVELLLPSPDGQIKIASILSAYDDLIENNTRRIKILEEMAQSIYREWFVKFRFPGHEKVRMVNSHLGKIPEGWDIKIAGDVFIIKYGKMLPTTEILSDGPYPVYGAGGVIGYHTECLMDQKVALVTCRGNGSGTVWRTRAPSYVTNNSFTITPRDIIKEWAYYFTEYALKNSNVMGVKSGSAQPQITIEGISTVRILIPDKKVVEEFLALGGPINELIDMLYQKNATLSKSRDILLPRLISGELDVSKLDIEVSKNAA